jgi:AcrR family transcriptional regulator
VGLDLLAETGLRGVTVASVCARLDVTKGSFYHHFDGVADLQQAMLEYWEELDGHERPASLEALPPVERLDALVRASVDRAHAVEAAIRTWSRSDERVAAAQGRLDGLRTSFVAGTLESLGVPRARARVLSEMGLAMLTGFQTRTGLVDRRVVRAAAEEWQLVLRAAVEDAATASTAKRRTRGPAAGRPAKGECP